MTSLLTLDQFFESVKQVTNRNTPISDEQREPFDPEQRKAIEHSFSKPLWLIAGPGTGKTHTLVWLTLKRILVDGIPVERLFIATFTNKAATELKERLALAVASLVQANIIERDAIKLEAMYVGTLHGLCTRILQEQRYQPTFRIRVLGDEISQQFYIRKSRNPLLNNEDITFWSFFGMLDSNSIYAPNRAKRAENAAKLFNRITENLVDIAALKQSSNNHLVQLAEAYEDYVSVLTGDDDPRIDQSYLQRHFLDFLDSTAGSDWLGSGFAVIVDEYQDTNYIQEQVYFALCGCGHDITVVGDDDQSIYRFRGATVQSLVAFDAACNHYISVRPHRVDLFTNRRSHARIVSWVNEFIRSQPNFQPFRAPGKQDLVADPSNPPGTYPAVMFIAENGNPATANVMCSSIQQLQRDGRINDLSEIAILTFSTKESSQGILTYTNAMRNAGIPFHNPRNRRAQNDGELQSLIGCVSLILDEQAAYTGTISLSGSLVTYIDNCRTAATRMLTNQNELRGYIERSQQAIRACNERYLSRHHGREVSISNLVYKLLSYPPFRDSMNNQMTGERFKVITQILASYEGLFYDGKLLLDGQLGQRHVASAYLSNFYSVFVDGFHDQLDDPEDDEVAIVPGCVNIMTIHQSKGLEFEVVFVLRPDHQPYLGDTHRLETLLEPYINRPSMPPGILGDEASRVMQDVIRLFFVAYSRAKRLLILTGATGDIGDWVLPLVNNQRITTWRELQTIIPRIR